MHEWTPTRKKTKRIVRVENINSGKVIDLKLMTWTSKFRGRREGWFRHGKQVVPTFRRDIDTVFVSTGTGKRFRRSEYVILEG